MEIKGTPPNIYLEHIAEPTDNLIHLSLLYNIDIESIKQLNGITDNKISPIIKIPLNASNFFQTGSGRKNEILLPLYYILARNETIKDVADRFKIPAAIIYKWSGLNNTATTGTPLVIGYLRARKDYLQQYQTAKKLGGKVTSINTVPTTKTTAADTTTLHPKKAIGPPKKDPSKTVGQEAQIQIIDKDTVATKENTVIIKPVIDSAITADSINSGSNSSFEKDKLKVFIDCSNTGCDNNFIRTEINYVDFFRDRLAADVHVLLTSQSNGSGGSTIQIIFFGQNKFKREADTLRFSINPNATDVERREEIVRHIKLGLLPFIAKTPYLQFMDLKVKNITAENRAVNTTTKDKWNYWVFNVGADGTINADANYTSSWASGNISANRTTDKLKVNFNAYGSMNDNSYRYEDSGITRVTKVKNSNYTFSHFLIKSISKHWSAGYEASYSNNTFSNNKSRINFRTGIEYAIFPYSQVNNRFLTINYTVDVRRNEYYDTTIYNQVKEILYGHQLQMNLSLNQKWGNITSNITYRNYFNDAKFKNLSMNLNVRVRITGGLSFYMYTSGGLVRDQVFLVKGGASEQDLLTRRRQLASGYNIYSGIGLNFRFGSMLNNFVNPRFESY